MCHFAPLFSVSLTDGETQPSLEAPHVFLGAHGPALSPFPFQ